MLIKSQKDFYAGLMFTVVGAGFGYGATGYTIGDGARMGRATSLVLGVVLALLGAAIMAQACLHGMPDGGKIGRWAWRPLGFIIGANVLFGIMIGAYPALGCRRWG